MDLGSMGLVTQCRGVKQGHSPRLPPPRPPPWPEQIKLPGSWPCGLCPRPAGPAGPPAAGSAGDRGLDAPVLRVSPDRPADADPASLTHGESAPGSSHRRQRRDAGAGTQRHPRDARATTASGEPRTPGTATQRGCGPERAEGREPQSSGRTSRLRTRGQRAQRRVPRQKLAKAEQIGGRRCDAQQEGRRGCGEEQQPKVGRPPADGQGSGTLSCPAGSVHVWHTEHGRQDWGPQRPQLGPTEDHVGLPRSCHGAAGGGGVSAVTRTRSSVHVSKKPRKQSLY